MIPDDTDCMKSVAPGCQSRRFCSFSIHSHSLPTFNNPQRCSSINQVIYQVVGPPLVPFWTLKKWLLDHLEPHHHRPPPQNPPPRHPRRHRPTPSPPGSRAVRGRRSIVREAPAVAYSDRHEGMSMKEPSSRRRPSWPARRRGMMGTGAGRHQGIEAKKQAMAWLLRERMEESCAANVFVAPVFWEKDETHIQRVMVLSIAFGEGARLILVDLWGQVGLHCAPRREPGGRTCSMFVWDFAPNSLRPASWSSLG